MSKQSFYFNLAGLLFLVNLQIAKTFGQSVQPEPRREIKCAKTISASCLSNDGHLIYLADGTEIAVYQTRTALKFKTGNLHSKTITAMCAHPRANIFATADSAGSIVVWNADNFAPIIKYDTIESSVKDIKFSRNGRFLAVVTHTPQKIQIYDLISPKPISTTYTLSDTVSSLFFDEPHNLILTGLENGQINTYTISENMDSIVFFKTLENIHTQKVTGILVLQNGAYASTSLDKSVRIWDMSSKIKKTVFLDAGIKSFDISNDQKNFVAGLSDNSISVLNSNSLSTAFTFPNTHPINKVSFHASEPIVFGIYSDNCARSWILR